jgi:hypothetical protein
MNAAAGVSPIKAPFAAIGSAGMTADYLGTFFIRSISISSGQSVDYIFGSPLPGPITEDNIQILGPAFLHPGSLRRDSDLLLSDGTPVYRFTIDIPPLDTNTTATLVWKNGSDILTRSGQLTLTRPQ